MTKAWPLKLKLLGMYVVKIMAKTKRKTYRLDDDSLKKLEDITVYLNKKYGISTLTGSLKYIIRKGDELAKENKL